MGTEASSHGAASKVTYVLVRAPVKLRAPKIFNLRRDPFERADENSNTYWDWVISHAYLLYGMQALVAEQIKAYKAFPPRQKPAAFNLDEVLRQLQVAAGIAHH